jgi:hypothetical protein
MPHATENETILKRVIFNHTQFHKVQLSFYENFLSASGIALGIVVESPERVGERGLVTDSPTRKGNALKIGKKVML